MLDVRLQNVSMQDLCKRDVGVREFLLQDARVQNIPEYPCLPDASVRDIPVTVGF